MGLGTWFINLFSSTNLQLLLLVGSGIIAISLLVLALTRWGHSRPVWKCVVLSFAAHILLMGYAYGTRMMVQPPMVEKQDNPMRVNIIKDVGKSLQGEDNHQASEKSWDQFVNQQPLPSAEVLERPDIDSEVVIEKVVDRSVDKPDNAAVPAELDKLPRQEIQSPQLADAPEQIEQDIPMLATDLEPEEIEIARRGAAAEPEDDFPVFEPEPEMARTEITNDFAPNDSDGQGLDALEPSLEKTPFVSDLVDEQSELPEAPEQPPAPAPQPKFAGGERLDAPKSSNRLKVISTPRRIGDGLPMPRLYSLRNAKNRLANAKQRGGSVETEQAVQLALQWLAGTQEENGSWDCRKSGAGREDQVFGHDRDGAGSQAECGITALATLAFLAGGHSHLEGPYQQEVQKGLEFLVRSQKTNGDLSGNAKMFARMYCHSMSLLALSEGLAMTGDKRLLKAVQRGVEYTVASQNRVDGGWRYQPGDKGDMSQFGWQVLALHSAKLGGAVIPNSTFQGMDRFLESCTSGTSGGLASYKPNQGPSTTMTAEALMCRYFLQKSVPQTTVAEATRRISRERPTPNHINLYYWYYGTLAMYHAGGIEWENWNTELKQTLLETQNRQGTKAGSWSPDGVWGGYGGDVYSTAMATLNLEVYYRYLPLYQQLAQANTNSNGIPFRTPLPNRDAITSSDQTDTPGASKWRNELRSLNGFRETSVR